jgi:hypothetical protein
MKALSGAVALNRAPVEGSTGLIPKSSNLVEYGSFEAQNA